MNRRAAKLEAYRRAASVLNTALDEAAYWLVDHYGEQDALKVETAMRELIMELDNRPNPPERSTR